MTGSAAYALYRLAAVIIPRAPPGAAHAAAAWLGHLLPLLPGPPRRLAQAAASNTSHVLALPRDHPRVQGVVRRQFAYAARNYVDLFRLETVPAAEILRTVRVHGWEHLVGAAGAARGVLMVTAHLGSIDWVGQLLALRGLRPVVVVERMQPPRLFDFVIGQRASFGLTLVPADEGVGRALRALREGRLVILVADWDYRGTGVVVDFFGARARLPQGPALLALRAATPIVPAFGLRTNGGFDAFVEPPLAARDTGNVRRDVELATQRVADVMAHYIGRYPEQWHMFHRVWHAQDGGSALTALPAGERLPS